VADTATEIAGKAFFHFLFCGRRVIVQEGLCAHDHAWRAKPALEGSMVDEGLLERINDSRFWINQAFDGGDFFSIAFYGQGHAREHRLTIDQDGTGTACAVVAGYLCTGKTERFPEGMGKGMARVNLAGLLSYSQIMKLAVHGKIYAAFSRNLFRT
jgi:hypothetical protein